MARDRKRAIALGAADARTVIGALSPIVLGIMTPAQIDQVQRVLDAAVVNPAVQKEADELYRQSITAQIGDQINRDPQKVAKASRKLQELVPYTPSDRQVRLDYRKMIAADALTPSTMENPDEIAFMAKMSARLEQYGVWLRIDQDFVALDPSEPSRRSIDPHYFKAWLSYGHDGEAINAPGGWLTRDVLLGSGVGSGYWAEVDEGPTRGTLEKQIKRLGYEIDDGFEEHRRLGRRKAEFPAVSFIAETLGRADDLPSYSIWQYPRDLMYAASAKVREGHFLMARSLLAVAAVITRNCAQALADYDNDTSTGASRAVTALRVAKTAGDIAQVVLAVGDVVVLARAGIKVVGGRVAASEVDTLATKELAKIVEKNPEFASDLEQTYYVRQPKGSVAGGVKPGTSSGAGQGWHTYP